VAVDEVEAALTAATAGVGRLLDPPSADGATRVLTTVADPAGSPIGLVSHAGGVQE
jgi:predicted enzyme related to lactoylglutathione lyase